MGRGVIPGNTKGLCVSSHNSRERKDHRYVGEKDTLHHLPWYFTEQSSVNQNALVGPQPNTVLRF
jgi:hypothetical protein